MRDALRSMSSWEYKLISSGPLGFASMKLLEEHLSQLGKDEWEIINFTTKPDNPLVFHGLARRPVARDWFPPAAAAKPAYTPPPVPVEEEDDGKDERSFADELPPSRPANAPAPADLGLGDFDDLAGSEEDLPTLFDALKPFLRKNSRGDLSVDLDFLAKKFEQDPRELLTAFEECGLKAPASADEKGDVVDHDGSLYWLERDRKGRVWVNTRDKKFRTAKAAPVPAEAVGGSLPPDQSGHKAPPTSEPRPERAPTPEPHTREPRREAAAPDPKSFLGRIRSMMRRNHRGQGWSGSFPYLTKALKLDEAQLLEKLAEHGMKLPSEAEPQPPLAPDGDVVFWLNKNQRGEIWINARVARENELAGTAASTATSAPAPAAPAAPVAETKALPPENTLTAVRLLMQPKKRGEGVTALVKELAEKLEKTEEQVMTVLASAGLNLPESPKAKPTFAEHGGEIFWLNVNAKGQVWLNAKASSATKKSRAKKAAE
jgi:hypothetical protein